MKRLLKRPINIEFALRGLGTSKLRAALTILGIIIGIAAVITIVSLGQGLSGATKAQMESLTSGMIEITSSSSSSSMGGMGGMMGGRSMFSMTQSTSSTAAVLTLDDVKAIKTFSSRVDAITAIIELSGTLAWSGQSVSNSEILGVTSEWLDVYQREMYLGRFISDQDNEDMSAVIVIGEQLAEDLMGSSTNPIGEVVRITVDDVTQSYTIIGVLASDSTVTSSQYTLIVPMDSAIARMPGARENGISTIIIRVDESDSDERDLAVAEINTILRASHKLESSESEDFTISDTMEFSESTSSFVQVLTIVLSMIAGISLIVGSIGLMNIMLVTVSERTWEIGMRRAIGAQRSDIMIQFLMEAIFLSLAGGIVGMVLGILGSYGVASLYEELQGYITVTPNIIGISIGVSAAVGILSGLYPAWRAARLQPTEALRHVA